MASQVSITLQDWLACTQGWVEQEDRALFHAVGNSIDLQLCPSEGSDFTWPFIAVLLHGPRLVLP